MSRPKTRQQIMCPKFFALLRSPYLTFAKLAPVSLSFMKRSRHVSLAALLMYEANNRFALVVEKLLEGLGSQTAWYVNCLLW